MKLPDFPLASWEVPRDSGIPLVAPADIIMRARWHGRETECLIRQVSFGGEERRFYREVGSDEVGNWLSSEFNSLKDQSHYAAMTYGCKHLRFDPENGCRLFCLDGARYGASGAHILTVGLGAGGWQRQGRRANFDLPRWGEQFYGWRAAHTGRMVRGELEKPNSDIRFAFDWLQLALPERQSLVFGVSQEDLKQIQLLMRHVLHADQWLGEQCWNGSEYDQSLRCEWSINAPNSSSQNSRTLSSLMVADEVLVENYEPHFYGYDEDDYLEMMPPRFSKWRSLFFQHFGIFPDEEIRRKIYDIEDREAKALCVMVTAPTAHQNLEAHVALREWFINIYANQQLSDLMGEQGV